MFFYDRLLVEFCSVILVVSFLCNAELTGLCILFMVHSITSSSEVMSMLTTAAVRCSVDLLLTNTTNVT